MPFLSAGVFFILVSFVGLRETVMNVLPVSLRNAIPIGIGLLIALVGLEWAGIVVDHPGTYVTLGDLQSAPVLLSLFGIGAIAILFALNVRGAILIGILASTIVGLLTGMVAFQGVVADPPSIAPTLFQLQIPNIFAEPNLIAIIFIFIFLDMFDTVGTLIWRQPASRFNGQRQTAEGTAGTAFRCGCHQCRCAARDINCYQLHRERVGDFRRGAHWLNQHCDGNPDAACLIL